MWRCILCAHQVELDDVIVSATGSRCICTHCYYRETGQPTPRLSSWYKDAFDQFTAAKLDAM